MSQDKMKKKKLRKALDTYGIVTLILGCKVISWLKVRDQLVFVGEQKSFRLVDNHYQMLLEQAFR